MWRTTDGLAFRVVSCGGRIPLALEEIPPGRAVVLVNLNSARLRACFTGPWIDRATAVADLGTGQEPFRTIFGAAYDRYRMNGTDGSLYVRGAQLRRIGRRIVHPLTREALRNDTLEVLIVAARYVDPREQVLAAGDARKVPRR
jgi:hypothetical protein